MALETRKSAFKYHNAIASTKELTYVVSIVEGCHTFLKEENMKCLIMNDIITNVDCH